MRPCRLAVVWLTGWRDLAVLQLGRDLLPPHLLSARSPGWAISLPLLPLPTPTHHAFLLHLSQPSSRYPKVLLLLLLLPGSCTTLLWLPSLCQRGMEEDDGVSRSLASRWRQPPAFCRLRSFLPRHCGRLCLCVSSASAALQAGRRAHSSVFLSITCQTLYSFDICRYVPLFPTFHQPKDLFNSFQIRRFQVVPSRHLSTNLSLFIASPGPDQGQALGVNSD